MTAFLISQNRVNEDEQVAFCPRSILVFIHAHTLRLNQCTHPNSSFTFFAIKIQQQVLFGFLLNRWWSENISLCVCGSSFVGRKWWLFRIQRISFTPQSFVITCTVLDCELSLNITVSLISDQLLLCFSRPNMVNVQFVQQKLIHQITFITRSSSSFSSSCDFEISFVFLTYF